MKVEIIKGETIPAKPAPWAVGDLIRNRSREAVVTSVEESGNAGVLHTCGYVKGSTSYVLPSWASDYRRVTPSPDDQTERKEEDKVVLTVSKAEFALLTRGVYTLTGAEEHDAAGRNEGLRFKLYDELSKVVL